MKKIIISITTIVIIWAILMSTDYYLIKTNENPIFSVEIASYKDGGSKEYCGLGYKIIKYVKMNSENDDISTEVRLGPWFMKYSP